MGHVESNPLLLLRKSSNPWERAPPILATAVTSARAWSKAHILSCPFVVLSPFWHILTIFHAPHSQDTRKPRAVLKRFKRHYNLLDAVSVAICCLWLGTSSLHILQDLLHGFVGNSISLNHTDVGWQHLSKAKLIKNINIAANNETATAMALYPAELVVGGKCLGQIPAVTHALKWLCLKIWHPLAPPKFKWKASKHNHYQHLSTIIYQSLWPRFVWE